MFNPNANLPPGTSPSDSEFFPDDYIECAYCGKLFLAQPEERVCPHCQALEDKGDDV